MHEKACGKSRLEKDLENVFSYFPCEFLAKTLHHIQLKITLTTKKSTSESAYENGIFPFLFQIPLHTFPFHAPIVTSLTRVFHPNVELKTGLVMLPILGRRDWSPVFTLCDILSNLQMMFVEPNAEFALNPTAAQMYSMDYEQFRQIVQKMLLFGGVYYGYEFQQHSQQRCKRSRPSEQLEQQNKKIRL